MITMTLHFPHADWTVELPAVPRQGENLHWKEGRFTVTSVDWHPDPEGEPHVSLALDPADAAAYQVMAAEEAEARIEAVEEGTR